MLELQIYKSSVFWVFEQLPIAHNTCDLQFNTATELKQLVSTPSQGTLFKNIQATLSI